MSTSITADEKKKSKREVAAKLQQNFEVLAGTGRSGGSKPKMTPEKVKVAASLMKDKTNRIKICKTLSVLCATLYRYVSPSEEIRPFQRNKP